MDRPRSGVVRPGPLCITGTVEANSVADIYPAEAGHPSPAGRPNHHDAADVGYPVVVVAVIATTHSTTTLAATSGSFGRDERRGAVGVDAGVARLFNRFTQFGKRTSVGTLGRRRCCASLEPPSL